MIMCGYWWLGGRIRKIGCIYMATTGNQSGEGKTPAWIPPGLFAPQLDSSTTPQIIIGHFRLHTPQVQGLFRYYLIEAKTTDREKR